MVTLILNLLSFDQPFQPLHLQCRTNRINNDLAIYKGFSQENWGKIIREKLFTIELLEFLNKLNVFPFVIFIKVHHLLSVGTNINNKVFKSFFKFLFKLYEIYIWNRITFGLIWLFLLLFLFTIFISKPIKIIEYWSGSLLFLLSLSLAWTCNLNFLNFLHNLIQIKV